MKCVPMLIFFYNTYKGNEKAMGVSKKQQAHVNKYIKNHYDSVHLTLPKGKKGIVKAAAEKEGMSTNAYINRAIEHELYRNGVENN